MKECKYCGTKRDDNAQFCPNCGASAVVSEEERRKAIREEQEEQNLRNAEKRRMKPRTKLIIIICSVIALIILGIVITVSAISSNNAKIEAENNRIVANGKSTNDLDRDYEEVKSLYSNGKYEEALDKIEQIPSAYKKYDEVQNTKNEIIKSYSDATIAKADEYVAAEKYSDALALLTTALEKTNNYQPLKSKYDEVLSGCKSSYLAKAKSYADSGDYTQAISTLETISSVIESDADIDAKILEYKKAIINDKLAEYEKSGDYASAITYLESELSNVSNDVDLTAKLNSYKTKYKIDLLNRAEEAYKSDGYKSAVKILNNGLKVLLNDTELKNKISEYNEHAPIPLNEIKVTAGDDYNFLDSACDPRDNMYSNVLELSSYSANWSSYYGEVEFYFGNQYSNFSCDIVPSDEFSTDSDVASYIKFFSDDKLIYTSEKITYKTTKINVSLDVTGVDYLKIEIENTTEHNLHTKDATTYLVNAQVKK